jgi:RNA polymerase sigma-70 factor (ECF subfamily)
VNDFDYQHWLAAARRWTRRRSEAADLLHDALIEAIRAQRTDFAREPNRRWFSGVLRNLAAMTARSAARRKRRETIVAGTKPASRDRSPKPSESFLYTLPPSARRVATLVVSGMDKREIIAALHLTDTSFRQRLTTIRKAWSDFTEAQAHADDADAPVDSDRALGLMRRALLRHVRQLGGVGTHDPDGHLIVLETVPAWPRQEKT